MNVLSVEIAGGQSAFAPGQTLSGTVAWEIDDDNKPVEVRLFWFTQGKGTQDVGVINKVKFDHPPRSGRREFKFTLPDGPQSFSGRLISLAWAVEAVCGNEMTRTEFVLSPWGEEIDLTESIQGVADDQSPG